MNLPLSSLFVNRHAPWPSCQMTFKRSPRLPLKQKRPPPMASRLSTSCTRRARLGKPHRMSACPVASHTRTPVGIGITVVSPALACSVAKPRHRRCDPRSRVGHSRSPPPECQSPPLPHALSSTGPPTQSGPAQIHLPDSRQAVLRDRPCATKTEAVSKAHDGVQPRTRKTFLDNPQLLGSRPAPTPTSLHNFKATHLATISKDIHTDSQLQTG